MKNIAHYIGIKLFDEIKFGLWIDVFQGQLSYGVRAGVIKDIDIEISQEICSLKNTIHNNKYYYHGKHQGRNRR